MKIELTRDKLLIIILNVLITVAEIIFINKSEYSLNFLPTLSILVTINIFVQIFSMKQLGMPIKSFFFLFICLLYVFHFGQVYCTAFLKEDPLEVTNMLKTAITNSNTAKKLFCIALGTINSYFIGGIVGSSYSDKYFEANTKDDIENVDNNCYKLGISLFLISTPFRLYIDIKQLIAAFNGGYFEAIGVTVSGVVSCIAGFWYIAVLFLTLSIKSESKRKVFIFFAIGYMLISMFTGNRGHQLVNILSMTFVLSYIENKKIRLIKLIKILIAGFVCLIVVNLIFRMRLYGISYMIENFRELMQDTFENNVIIQTIYELGGTIKTPYLVVDGMDDKLHPFFGETILRGLLVCIPDITGVLNNNTSRAILGRVLNKAFNVSALGGSFIGEMYYNFKNFFWLFSLLFGIVYYRSSVNLIYAIVNRKQEIICKYLPFLVYSLWWVRDSFCGMFRPVVWITLINFLVKCIKIKDDFPSNKEGWRDYKIN